MTGTSLRYLLGSWGVEQLHPVEDEFVILTDRGFVATEIEADAVAVALVTADMVGQSVGEDKATLRLLAIRLALHVLGRRSTGGSAGSCPSAARAGRLVI